MNRTSFPIPMARVAALVISCAMLNLGLDAWAQGPRAPVQLNRPLWFSNWAPTFGLHVFDPLTGGQIAVMPQTAGYIPGPFAVDPAYPASFSTTGGQRTCMQVNAGAGGPTFVRWALPPRATWGPSALLVQIGAPSPAVPGSTNVHGMIISAITGDMITVEDVTGTGTAIVQYKFSGGFWNVTAIIPLTGAFPYSIARVTLDYNNTYWVAGWHSIAPGTAFLWSWTPSLGLQQMPTLTSLGLSPYGAEELSWLTTERPVGSYAQGLIHLTTRLVNPPSGEGFGLYVFDPVTNAWTVPAQGSGGNQAWPDPSLGLTGNGVVATFVVLGVLLPVPPNVPTIMWYSHAAACWQLNTFIPQPGPVLTGAMQMDFTSSVSRLVVTTWGSTWSYRYYSMPTCAAPGTLLATVVIGAVLSVLGVGWHYAELITTGTITYPY